jgi:glycosyltransferase involved in cell wall biosynthesis
LVVFGQGAPEAPPKLGFPIHYTGHLHDDLSLRALYSAADAVVVPSRQEAFGQTASEAHACGTPVIAFNVGGLPDIVVHRRTGYIAKALDPVDLATGISWLLSQQDGALLRSNARAWAVAQFASERIAREYRSVYRIAVGNGSQP